MKITALAPWFGSNRQLAGRLATFCDTLVLIRYHDHPLIRELYRAGDWHWTALEGRNSANNSTPEVLISNRTPV